MPEKPSNSSALPPGGAEKDIAPLLKGWDYESGTINVRKIMGADGRVKVQMRLDLGLLQMEMTGRPDGLRPHGMESQLAYAQSLLADHVKQTGSPEDFAINRDQCQLLRDEAMMYYHRYLSLFVLEDFVEVVRDTLRNMEALDFTVAYADNQADKIALEQYRPYLVMMNTRAAASLLHQNGDLSGALRRVRVGLDDIEAFFEKWNKPEAFAASNEVRILRDFEKDLRKKIPPDPLEGLQTQLKEAIRQEHYERAAQLRDQIRKQTEKR